MDNEDNKNKYNNNLEKRIPKNYIQTDFGLIPNPYIPEPVKELYSNYFMVKETISSKTRFFNFEKGYITLITHESRDYEDPDNIETRENIGSIVLTLFGKKNFEELHKNIETFSEIYRTSLMPVNSFKYLKSYSIKNECVATIKALKKLRVNNSSLKLIPNKETKFSITCKNNAHILDITDLCFSEMSVYRDVLEDYGFDWDSAEDKFYSLGYDDLYFTHRIEEVPRDFWENPRDVFQKMDKDELEGVLDCYLDLYKSSNTEIERQIEIIDSIEFIRKLLIQQENAMLNKKIE